MIAFTLAYVYWRYRSSRTKAGSATNIGKDSTTSSRVALLQTQRALRVTPYRTWWPSTLLLWSWIVLMLASIFMGFAYFYEWFWPKRDIQLCLIILVSTCFLETVALCIFMAGKRGPLRFRRLGLVGTPGVENATHVFVEELECSNPKRGGGDGDKKVGTLGLDPSKMSSSSLGRKKRAPSSRASSKKAMLTERSGTTAGSGSLHSNMDSLEEIPEG